MITTDLLLLEILIRERRIEIERAGKPDRPNAASSCVDCARDPAQVGS